MKLFVGIVNGPNLNLLGKREVGTYGSKTLHHIESDCRKKFDNLANLDFFQSNSEHDIIEYIQKFDGHGLVLNLGAFTHTSIAIRDAISFLIDIKKVKVVCEVHISNVYRREEFRSKSYISDISNCVISGCGDLGYQYAIDFCLNSYLP